MLARIKPKQPAVCAEPEIAGCVFQDSVHGRVWRLEIVCLKKSGDRVEAAKAVLRPKPHRARMIHTDCVDIIVIKASRLIRMLVDGELSRGRIESVHSSPGGADP